MVERGVLVATVRFRVSGRESGTRGVTSCYLPKATDWDPWQDTLRYYSDTEIMATALPARKADELRAPIGEWSAGAGDGGTVVHCDGLDRNEMAVHDEQVTR